MSDKPEEPGIVVGYNFPLVRELTKDITQAFEKLVSGGLYPGKLIADLADELYLLGWQKRKPE